MKYSDIYRLYSTSQPKDAIHQALREVPVDDSDEQYEDRSPLHLACQYGDTEGVKILLERDAEPNTKDANGSTPIHILGRTSAGCADEDKLKEIAVMLIEQGANIPRSAKNTTALIECIRNRHFKMAEAIIDSGARVNSTDLNGENVLFGFCAASGDIRRDIRFAKKELDESVQYRYPENKIEEIRSRIARLEDDGETAYRLARRLVEEAKADPEFHKELARLNQQYVGRPSPLTEAPRFAQRLKEKTGLDARVLLKREDLNHTGAHKINNALGQALLVKRMGKTRVIAETGAGQHGVATATVCAMLGLKCRIYMGQIDARRQALNVARMRMLGAEVVEVTLGDRILKDAINEALRDWVTNVKDTHYLLGTVAGPHPFPSMVRDFQKIIGEEAKQQLQDWYGIDHPDAICACVGGGSNAIGIMNAFLDDERVNLYGYEAGGNGP